MRTSLVAACFALTLAAPVSQAADLPANHPPMEGSRQLTPPSHSGEVLEAIPAAGYVYLHVKGPEGDEWLAAPAADLKPGTKVNWNDGMMMQNFTSKTLNRTFASIRFVETVERAK
jgi:hypothetical protein